MIFCFTSAASLRPAFDFRQGVVEFNNGSPKLLCFDSIAEDNRDNVAKSICGSLGQSIV